MLGIYFFYRVLAPSTAGRLPPSSGLQSTLRPLLNIPDATAWTAQILQSIHSSTQ
jgi:hypothetical protein